MVAQAVIEKIALPIHTVFSSDKLLLIPDGRLHARFARKRNNRVQMIRHKQTKAVMPDKSLVVEFHGGEHNIASFCAAELVLPGGTQLMVIKNQLPSATHCGMA